MTTVGLVDGRIVVPDNRWDLVDVTAPTPPVSVVIPYYNQPHQLALVLEALTAQSYPVEQMEVVIADDGSAERPDVGRWRSHLTVTVVTQEDKGFRAAAARNLGAASATGSILCFLDADTVPTIDYIRCAVRLPASAPDTLVVGRRKHADLGEVAKGSMVDWMAAHAHTERTHSAEPQWLVDGYERTANLLEPGWDGYKYMISAVMTCSRDLFDDVGGFDESFVGYGGEDWELANRAFMMGGVFVHEPAAVAWHDGPDWADRAVPDRLSQKNAEALALAPLITDPAARSAGLLYAIPDVVVVLSTDGHTPASLTQTVSSALRDVDAAVWLTGEDADVLYRALGVQDSRIRLGNPDSATLSRCRYVAEVAGRVVFSAGAVSRLADELSPGRAGRVDVDFDTRQSASVTMWSSRAQHRTRRWAGQTAQTDLTEEELARRLFGVRHLSQSEVGIVVAESDTPLSW
jgi:GT2 family glycosyltransferase